MTWPLVPVVVVGIVCAFLYVGMLVTGRWPWDKR
jgi:hypothetical protein